MNRYLFKAKRVDNGEWVEGYYLLNETTKIVVPQTWDSWLTYEVIPETISQYTGLKDKLGNEIYENDIVKASLVNGTFTYKVIFENGTFMLTNFYFDDIPIEIGMFKLKLFEVTGNIFDKEVCK